MSAAFLGVEKSCSDKRWVMRSYDERMTLALSQRLGLPDVVARSLSARGLDLETASSFLEPRLRDLMPDPSLFVDMDKAASAFVEAIRLQKKIAVFGDYDVDGATSSALLVRYLRALGCASRLYIPDRMTEGYGPNPTAMQKLAAEGIKLVVCVDCGTTAHEALARAKQCALDVIVIDHHAAEPDLPPAVAIVNPNRLDDPNSMAFGNLAAVGVTYLFIIAVNRMLRQQQAFAGKAEPDLLSLLDLVALGTVCDVVKLTGLNRAYVAQGLRVMGQRRNEGIKALMNVSAAKGPCDPYTAGFVLGPRLNAGGRVGQSDLGALLLSCDDPLQAMAMAERLNAHNDERREIEARVLLEAEAMMFNDVAPLSFVASENWHAGVIGIVASRLKDKFNRPALVIALDGDIGKGSGRSIGNIDLGAAIIAARQAGLLIAGGGHKMAAGFTVARDKVDALRAFLMDRIGKQLEAEPFEQTLTVDGLVAASALTPDFMEKLAQLAPFGMGNAEPRFALADCRLIRATVVGEKHVSLIVSQGGTSLRAIAFRAMENNLGPSLLSAKGRPIHLAGHIRLDDWKGDGSVQLLVDDAAGVPQVA